MARYNSSQPQEFEEKVVQVNRVSKKTKGGNSIGFSVVVVVGDKKGKVGVGLGKGPDVLSSIQKASRRAKKRMFTVPLHGDTIPFQVQVKKGAAVVLLKPAPVGTGVIAGGAVRAVVEAAGVKNIVSKILGSNNQASNVYATFEALRHIRRVADIKGIKLDTKQTTPKPSPTTKPQPGLQTKPNVKPQPKPQTTPHPKPAPSNAKNAPAKKSAPAKKTSSTKKTK